MITKSEFIQRSSRNPFRSPTDDDDDGPNFYGSEGVQNTNNSNEAFSAGHSGIIGASFRPDANQNERPLSMPPDYDDPNYIASPTSMSQGQFQSMPLLLPQPTQSSTTSRSMISRQQSTYAPSTVTSYTYAMSPDVEQEWARELHELERNMSKLQAARSRASRPKQVDAEETAREVRELEDMVYNNMCRLASIHPDPVVQDEWKMRAEVFGRTMNTPPPGSVSVHEDGDDHADEGTTVVGHSDLASAEDDFIIDRRHKSGHLHNPVGTSSSSSFPSSRIGSGFGMGDLGRRMRSKVENDKGMSVIAKGTAGIFLAPIAISGALIYGTAALAYGGGKAAAKLGKKAVNAASVHGGGHAGSTRAGPVYPSGGEPGPSDYASRLGMGADADVPAEDYSMKGGAMGSSSGSNFGFLKRRKSF